MGRFGRFIGVAGVIGLGALLGGCSSVSQEEYDLAVQEASQLRERSASLEASNREKDVRIAELESQQRATPPAPDRGGDRAVVQVYELAGNVLFDSGSATIKGTAKRSLDSVVASIQGRYPDADIRVEGHTDADPIRKSKWASNEALSEGRAEAVRKYLAAAGIAASRIDAVGYGASKPKATKAASRRVEVVVLATN